MIDFLIAGLLYTAIMFVVFFLVSFITIGMAYATALVFRRFANWMQPSSLALK